MDDRFLQWACLFPANFTEGSIEKVAGCMQFYNRCYSNNFIEAFENSETASFPNINLSTWTKKLNNLKNIV